MDALVEGLEIKLQEWEADLNESYDLIRDVKSRKAKAVKPWNWLRLYIIIDHYKAIFGIDPSKDELADLMGVSRKTVERIMGDEEFNFYVRAIRKTTLGREWKRIARVKPDEDAKVKIPIDQDAGEEAGAHPVKPDEDAKVKIPIVVPRSSRRYFWYDSKAGRPHIRYSDRYKGMPGGAVIGMETPSLVCKHVRKEHPELLPKLEEYLKIIDHEEEGKLVYINFDTLNVNYLPEVIGAIAHRIIEIYALPSTGRVYTEAHDMFEKLNKRLIKMLERSEPNGSPSYKDINEIRKIMDESVNRWERFVKFSELELGKEKRNLLPTTMKRRACVIALAFKEWIDWYGCRKSKIGEIEKMLSEADSVSEVTNAIFDTIRGQVENIIQSVDFENMLSGR